LEYGGISTVGGNLHTSGRFCVRFTAEWAGTAKPLEAKMHGLIYLIGLIVVIMAILSFFGLR
jgi:hypothetical protein